MSGRVVTPEDLKPAGWQCEACGGEFAVGDEAFGSILSFTDQTPRDWEAAMTPEQRAEVEDWDTPIPVLGDYRCSRCFDEDRPVKETA